MRVYVSMRGNENSSWRKYQILGIPNYLEVKKIVGEWVVSMEKGGGGRGYSL